MTALVSAALTMSITSANAQDGDPCPTPTPAPTETPAPTPEPTPEPTPNPTPEPTPEPTPNPTPTPTAPANHRVYQAGDSYTFDMKALGLDAALGGDWQLTSSGVGGRGIAGTPSPSLNQQVTKDAAVIARAGTYVMQVGTNVAPDGKYFASRLQNHLALVRKTNPELRILWLVPGNYSTQAATLAQRIREVEAILPSLQTPTSSFELVRWDRVMRAEHFAASDGFKHPRVDGPDPGTRPDGYDAMIALERQAILAGG